MANGTVTVTNARGQRRLKGAINRGTITFNIAGGVAKLINVETKSLRPAVHERRLTIELARHAQHVSLKSPHE